MLLIFSTNHEHVLLKSADGQSFGRFSAILIRPGNDNYWNPFHMVPTLHMQPDSDTKIVWSTRSGSVTLELAVEQADDEIRGRLTASGYGKAIVRLIWELPTDDYHPFMPAFMYGENKGGDSTWATYPRLCRTNEGMAFHTPWISDEWLVRADRSSHGFTSLIGSQNTFAIGGRDVGRYENGLIAEKNGLGISYHRLSFSLGYANEPYTYSVIPGRNAITRTEGYVDLDRGPVSCDLYFQILRSEEIHRSASKLMRSYYSVMHTPAPKSDKDSIRRALYDVAEAVYRYAYDQTAKNFYVTLPDAAASPDAEPFVPAYNTGWAGGMRTAYPLLLAGYQLQNRTWVDCACDVTDNIANNAVSKASGMFYENYDPIKTEWNSKGWWYRDLEIPGHSGYINGQVCYYMLSCYLYTEKRGDTHSLWLNAVEQVLDHIVETQLPSGSFGYIYSESDGQIIDPDGFSGCWFTPALALLYLITGNARYLVSAEKAADYYYCFVKGLNVYGGPHDIFKSPDEEGILAFIKACELLHGITVNPRYLDRMVDGIEYEFSWKFSYNPVMEVEPLKTMNWNCCGGSVTSVNNSHIHPMGSSLLANLAYVAWKTKDAYQADRLRDTLNWTLSCYLHKDGEFSWGKKGLINERYCYTDSLLAERFVDGSPASTWFCAHSWASGAVLEGLVEITERGFDYD